MVEVAISVEAVVAFELGGDMRRIGVVEEDDTDGLDDAVGFIDAVAAERGLKQAFGEKLRPFGANYRSLHSGNGALRASYLRLHSATASFPFNYLRFFSTTGRFGVIYLPFTSTIGRFGGIYLPLYSATGRLIDAYLRLRSGNCPLQRSERRSRRAFSPFLMP